MTRTDTLNTLPTNDPAPAPRSQPGFVHVLACVDSSPEARFVLEQAAAMAGIMGAKLSVIRVMQPAPGAPMPSDPLDWDLSRRDVKAELDRMVEAVAEVDQVGTEVLHGAPADRICRWAAENRVDLTVLGTGGHGGWARWGLGGTVRRIAENIGGSVMVVPAPRDSAPVGPVHFSRVMVALDSSPQAESALPVATRIATNQKAELLLVHAVPGTSLTSNGPPAAEDRELCERLRERNERVAKDYLGRMRALTPANELRTRVRLLKERDPRHALSAAVTDEGADLLVLSKCGLGGHRDLPIGSTAEFLISGATTPVLLINCGRRGPARRHVHAPRRPLPGRVLS